MQIRTLQIIVIIIFLIGIGHSGVAQTIVPIEKEPRHRLKFENQYIRLFDVLIPKSVTTLYHIHKNDGIGIRLSDTKLLDEALTGEKSETVVKKGEVTFAYRPIPITHRVTDIGISEFRNILIEVLPSTIGQSIVKSPEPLPGHEILISNDRVTVYRLILQPGQSTQVHTHILKGIGVVVSDAKIQIMTPDKKPKTMKLKAGNYVWHPAGTTHVIKNIGSKVFEAIDIELK